MAPLITDPNLFSPDDFYADLIAAHEGLSDDESEALNSRLILVMANHIGNQQVLREALEASK